MRLTRNDALAAALAAATALACSASNGDPTRRPISGQGGSGGAGAAGGVPGGGVGGLGVGGTGTSGTGGVDDVCAAVSQQAENKLQPADIVWAIDTSCSMTEENLAVQLNMNAFSQQIVASGIDTHIVVIAEYRNPFCPPGFPCPGVCIEPPLGSGGCPTFDTNPDGGYWHLNQKVGSTNSLSLIINTYIDWAPMLRPNASKTFVVISDDNQETDPIFSADDFIQAVGQLDVSLFAEWQFHGIFSYTDCPAAARPGTVYQDLVAKTGGVSGDLCLQNFKPVFDQIATGVITAAKLDCEWEIPPPPDGELFVPGEVNVRYTSSAGLEQDVLFVGTPADCGAAGGWYYDDPQNPSKVLACPTTCDEIRLDENGKIDVLFGCATIVQPK